MNYAMARGVVENQRVEIENDPDPARVKLVLDRNQGPSLSFEQCIITFSQSLPFLISLTLQDETKHREGVEENDIT